MTAIAIAVSISRPALRSVPDSRPQAIGLPVHHLPVAGQQMLELALDDQLAQPGSPVDPVRMAQWGDLRPARHLPAAEPWSASLAQAIIETLQGRRPTGQLTRWVDERVLASISLRVRQGRTNRPAAVRRAVLKSVRIQFPHAEVAEVSIHLLVGRRSAAMALRLEAWQGRWLCTALELGPSMPNGPS